jgi:hypothetical protein
MSGQHRKHNNRSHDGEARRRRVAGVNTRGFARLGMLAVGLGIGVAVAHSPVASADSSSDWLSSIDSLLGGSALPAPSSGLDLAISFDGYSLLHDGSATASTNSGDYSFAIAEGAGSSAYAGGIGESAYADGAGATASADGGLGDVAEAYGTNAYAAAGGDTGDTSATYDTAIDIGNNDVPTTGYSDGAFAGNADLVANPSGGTGAYDTAIDIGNNTNDVSEAVGGSDGAYAGAGGLNGGTGDGNNDTAIDFGINSGQGDGSFADGGNGNYASESGSITGEDEGVLAGFGNDNTVVDDASYTTNDYGGFAEGGNDNYVSVLGPENTFASASEGNSNIAYVSDPFGSTASEAISGAGGNSDLAAVLLTDGTATATGNNFLYDILTALGPESGTF